MISWHRRISANDTATSRNQKTITVDHIFESLKDLEWGEADTEALRKDLKRQLRGEFDNQRLFNEIMSGRQTAHAPVTQWQPSATTRG